MTLGFLYHLTDITLHCAVIACWSNCQLIESVVNVSNIVFPPIGNTNEANFVICSCSYTGTFLSSIVQTCAGGVTGVWKRKRLCSNWSWRMNTNLSVFVNSCGKSFNYMSPRRLLNFCVFLSCWLDKCKKKLAGLDAWVLVAVKLWLPSVYDILHKYPYAFVQSLA